MKNSIKLALGSLSLLSLIGAVSLSRLVPTTQPASAAITLQENNKQGNKQSAQQLQSLAKITPQQAQQAAIAAHPGQVSQIQLENEDGNLVYSVVIGQNEVKVDAGNGNVLYTDSLNPESDATVRPRSSVQVPEPAGGDGDGETQDDR